MNVNIYIDDEFYKVLVSYSKEHHISHSAFWKKGFFDFEPLSSFPSKEELRMELIEPKDDLLA